MAKTRAQKEETVQIITEKLSRAKAVVFADYKGMNMKQLSDLRDKLRDVNSELSVIKNTLMRKALLEGPTHNASSTSNASRTRLQRCRKFTGSGFLTYST